MTKPQMSLKDICKKKKQKEKKTAPQELF